MKTGDSGGIPIPVQVFGRWDDETIHALGWPASKKRQGTNSRVRGGDRAAGYGDLAAVRDLTTA
jgi:hypothetical protein